jgi:hypothetical protein
MSSAFAGIICCVCNSMKASIQNPLSILIVALCCLLLSKALVAQQVTADNHYAFAYTAGLRLGFGTSGINTNLTASAGLQAGYPVANVNMLVCGSVYRGSQLGTATGNGFQFDVSSGMYATVGKGRGKQHNFYTLNYNTPSPFKNEYDLSVSWGQMITYNSAINALHDGPGRQMQGIFGGRLGNNFSFSYNNDAGTVPTFANIFRRLLGIKATDAGWTGGLTIRAASVEAGYQDFSGYRIEPNPTPELGQHYAQTPYHQSLNKASNVLQYSFVSYGNFRLEYFGSAWLQNFIHNKLSKQATYWYNYRGFNFSGAITTR